MTAPVTESRVDRLTPETLSKWDDITDETIATDLADTEAGHEQNEGLLNFLRALPFPSPRETFMIEKHTKVQADRLDFIAFLKKLQQMRKDRADGKN